MDARNSTTGGFSSDPSGVETHETVESTLLEMKRLFGRKWHPVVIHRLLRADSMGFSELKSDIDGISGKMLAESLTKLEEAGLIEREIESERPIRVEYALTDCGESLEPVLVEMIAWTRECVVDAGHGPDERGD